MVYQLEFGGCIFHTGVAIRVTEEGEAAIGFGDGFRGGGRGELEDLIVIVCRCGGRHEIGMRVG